MKQIEDQISVLVENHFPQLYKEEGENFVAFVKEYYDWLQQSNNAVYYSRNLFEFRDIDSTIEEFLVHFKEKYLVEAPVFYDSTRSNVKNALDFYRSKGTERGTELLFREVWGLNDVDIYFPGKDVLKASDGEWYIPKYLELSLSDKTASFVGKQVTGSLSGATAFVEGVVRRSVLGKYIDIAYLTNIKGNFLYEELITSDGDLTDSPRVVGSMTQILINDSGRDFNVGDVVNVISDVKGKEAKARVDTIGTTSGKVTFTLDDGGSGYRLSTQPVIAEKMLQVTNVTSSCTYTTSFLIDETVFQPLSNVSIYSSNSFFSIGSLLVGANSTTNVATGQIVGTTQKQITGTLTANSTSNVVVGSNTTFTSQISNGNFIRFQSCTSIYEVSSVTNNISLVLTTTGPNVTANSATISNANILVVKSSGDFSLADRISDSTALIGSVQDRTASGKIVGVNSTFIGLTSVSNTFTTNNYNFIYGSTSNVYANVVVVGVGSDANVSIGSLTDEEVVFLNLDLLSDNTSISTTLLTGTVSSNSSSPQVNGVSTNFTTDLYHGAHVKFSGNSNIFQVNSVTNTTVLTLTTNGPDTTSNTLSITNGEMMTLPLNAFKYGFPKYPTANVSTILNLVLTRESASIGTIASLTGINPGTGYNVPPFVLIRDQGIAGLGRRDLSLSVSNVTGVFVVGEELTQDFSTPSYTVQTSGSNSGLTVTESVTQQVNATTNVYGTAASSNTTISVINIDGALINSSISSALTGTVSANATSAQVNGVGTAFTTNLSNGSFVKFSGNNLIFQVNAISNDTILTLTTNAAVVTANQIYETSNVLVGMTSGKFLFVNNAIQNNQISISRGSVLAVAPTNLAVKRKTLNQSFTPGVQITGSISGTTANVESVSQIAGSSLMGNNAVLTTTAGIVTGSITSVSVIDSGVGYENGELVTLEKPNSSFVATGYANLINQGFKEGYFKSTRGFLNSDKYIHDGDFYQFYSYQVKAGVPLSVYGDTLKKLCHLAGTKLFGNVVKTSSLDVKITTSGVNIET
jgi:hypothetical protein